MKIWFTFMSGPGSLEDLMELWEPIKAHFNGLVCTFHGEREDPEAQYLESNKGEGKVIYLPYSGRHDFSRNAYLYCGPIQNNDIVCQTDLLERLNPLFAGRIRELMTSMPQIDAFYYYGKILLYRYHESVIFYGSPHEGWYFRHKVPTTFELNVQHPNESDVRLNVRPQKRDSQHFIKHYLSYYLLPWGSNHLRLGEDKALAAGITFEEREARRMKFKKWCFGQDLKTADDVKNYMLTTKDLPEEFKEFVRKEKILNDCYRAWVLGQKVIDNHDHFDMVKV